MRFERLNHTDFIEDEIDVEVFDAVGGKISAGPQVGARLCGN